MGTHSEWHWDYKKNAWVAQVNQGNIILIATTIYAKYSCVPNMT